MNAQRMLTIISHLTFSHIAKAASLELNIIVRPNSLESIDFQCFSLLSDLIGAHDMLPRKVLIKSGKSNSYFESSQQSAIENMERKRVAILKHFRDLTRVVVGGVSAIKS